MYNRQVSRISSIFIAAACIFATALSPAQASAPAADPTPPKDAKKIVSSIKTGTLKLDVEDAEILAKQQAQDFERHRHLYKPKRRALLLRYRVSSR